MTFGREFSTPCLSRERERSVLTPNPTGSVRGCFVGWPPSIAIHPTCARNTIYDIIYALMDTLSQLTTLFERRTYAGDGMGVSAFCLKEVA